MKKNIVKLLLAVSALAAPLAARADVIWYDNFNYTNGSLAATNFPSFILSAVLTNNVSGGYWIRESGSANPSDMYVVNSNLQVCATGGGNISRQDDCCRYFATTNGTTFANLYATYGNTQYDQPLLLYASFTVTCSAAISNNAGLPNQYGSYFASFYSNTNYGSGGGGVATTNANGYGYVGRVQAFTNGTILPNTWRLGVTGNSLATNPPNGGFPVDLAVNTPYQVVEELDPITLRAATIWVNPINPYQTGNSPVDTAYTSSDSFGKLLLYGVNGYAFRQPSSFGSAAFTISNVCIATTFAEAMTNVMSTNAVPPVIVYQPVSVTNFIGSSFNLSAVANGQGLASLTYQWQQNSNNITNPNGNSSVFPISNASAGTNYYDLIVTTPYGLSATSAVAKVAVSAAPAPPTFITQPASQALYAGQNVIFSTTVSSPGNVSYTWYSNNVVMTSGTITSSGESSSLEIDNLVAANAASYKVAVTNDVWPTGIVSTNAVLTVKTPAQVTIAYLRTLVDPVTYQPTNTPPSIPYQVTGTVTTYTNLTTGNTSSYFLQDGTAGINIFVTGGSTFRPAQGDVVTFVGVLSSYTTGLELYADTADTSFPYTSFTDTGTTNALPAPIAIPYTVMNNPSNANYNLGGSLVKISDVHFGARAGTTTSTSANDVVVVTNSAGQPFQLLFPDLDLDVAGQTLPNYAYSVSGVLYSANNVVTNEIVVTRFSDIITNAPPTPIPLNLGFTAGALTFNWSDPTFSLQSSTNVTGPYSTIPGASTGFTTNTTAAPTMFFRLYHP